MLAIDLRTAATLALPVTVLAVEAMLIVAVLDLPFNLNSIFEQPNAATEHFVGPATVGVPIQEFEYRLSGVHVVDGEEVDAEIERRTLSAELHITRDQITVADYEACVAAGACDRIVSRWPANGELRPVTGVNFDDAVNFAAWLSLQTDQTWRLPTDAEWVAAAGTRARDDAVGTNGSIDNPAARRLEAYSQQNEARGAIGQPQPTGYFGANEFGLYDFSGNIWEWTDTCFTRTRMSADRDLLSVVDTCAVRVVQGLHRTYISTFIRDAKAGGCSVGAPPNHLGFRLVREIELGPFERVLGWVQTAVNKLLMRA